MKIVTYTTIYNVEIDLSIDISFFNSRVVTTTNPQKINPQLKKSKGGKYLCFIIELEIEDFESITDAAMYARPTLLILMSIITFFTSEVLIPTSAIENSITIGPLTKGLKNKFRFNNTSLLKEYLKLVYFLDKADKSKRMLVYSSLDRWRKARFLEFESEDNMIHNDEIMLSYFHILELLSEEYYGIQKKEAEVLIEDFTDSILTKIFLLEDKRLQSEFNAKKKLTEAIFIPELPVASKIMFMFKQQGILTTRLKHFISDLVKDRNSVAHGKNAYKEKVIFPMPPFFPLISIKNYSFEMLRVLTATAISNTIGINLFERKWFEISESLTPTVEELNVFIKDKKFVSLTLDEFYEGKENDIIPYTFTHYLLTKKIKPEIAIPALENLILNYRKKEEEIVQIVIAIILIVDITQDPLRKKCLEILQIASDNKWIPDFKMRDVLYYLEYLGHTPKVFRDLLEKKVIY